MRKQIGYRRYMYVVFAIILLICSWEANLNSSVIMAAGIGVEADRSTASAIIPQESIRLRILANSDSPADQWIKREVRDAIVEEMNQWVAEPQGIEAARKAVRDHLPELDELVGRKLRQYGFASSYQVELGRVPFPAKMYGSQIYPAGDYEALRVSIGLAEGQNWWCVLFPPLCFVDSEMITKKPAELSTEDRVSRTKNEPLVSGSTGYSGQQSSSKLQAADGAGTVQPEVHFFLWDLLKKLFA
jgi:stage II sporulation protein R